MLKIIIVLEENYKVNKFKELVEFFEKSEKYVGKIKFKVVENTKRNIRGIKDNECDVILCIKCSDEIVKKKKPVIICERYDSCTLSTHTELKFVKNKNVKAVFKEYIFKEKENYMNKYLGNRYHFYLINGKKEEDMVMNAEITKECIDKIKCVTWNLKQYSNIGSYNMNFLKKHPNMEKKIDVFFICHPHGEKNELYTHRKNGVEKLKEISDRNPNLKITTKNVEPREYNKRLLESKVCIAPYGLGSRIALDQMGILANTIVIKPRMDFVVASPDIYREDMYEYCDINFSNLEEIIYKVLDNYDKYKEIARERKEKLVKYDSEYYIDKFYENVMELL